ncbi:hypothetical protein B0H13DRAFT_1623012 [Mycena leptocephala]|nr:hypothetical protein B0H13DRAFT_1623012 [Mycena leptocephala]
MALRSHFLPRILVYPVSVTWRDWNRLEPDQYLNDSIMELGIQLWLMDLKKKDPNLVDQVHIFNTFFFKLLSENGYQQVRKWTSKFDLFSKKYILVPINNPSR